MQALQRYNFLMGKASKAMDTEKIYRKNSAGFKPYGSTTSQRIMIVILASNTVLFGFTLGVMGSAGSL